MSRLEKHLKFILFNCLFKIISTLESQSVPYSKDEEMWHGQGLTGGGREAGLNPKPAEPRGIHSAPFSPQHLQSIHQPILLCVKAGISAARLEAYSQRKGRSSSRKMESMASDRLKNRFLPHVPQSHPTDTLLTARLPSFLLSSEASSAFPLPCQQHESKIQMPAGARKHVRSKRARSGGYCSTRECTQS